MLRFYSYLNEKYFKLYFVTLVKKTNVFSHKTAEIINVQWSSDY